MAVIEAAYYAESQRELEGKREVKAMAADLWAKQQREVAAKHPRLIGKFFEVDLEEFAPDGQVTMDFMVKVNAHLRDAYGIEGAALGTAAAAILNVLVAYDTALAKVAPESYVYRRDLVDE